MASVRFTITGLDQLQRMAEALSPRTLARAQRAGIAAAGRAVPAAAGRGIAASYGIGSRRARSDIRRPRVEADGSAVTVGFSRRPPTLTQYGARPGTRATGQPGLGRGMGWGKPGRPGRALSALVLRADGRRPVAGAFQITGKGGNRLTVRRGRDGRLQSLYGPSVGSIFAGRSDAGPQLRSDAETAARAAFLKAFQRTLDSAARGY